jgi:hypothetical protein
MATRVTEQDKTEFRGYLRNCTDEQVRGVYQKERDAGRRTYAQLAVEEGLRRGFDVREG